MAEQTHDLSMRRWGRSYAVNEIRKDGEYLHIMGIATPMPDPGDFVLLVGPDGLPTRYRLLSVDPQRNPRDMFYADCRWEPFEGETRDE